MTRKTNVKGFPIGFLGREADLAAIDARFAEGARLVTLLGPGGIGKTRLALRWAELRARDHAEAGGLFVIELADARDLLSVVRAMSDALGVPLGARDPEAAIGAFAHAIDRGPSLLVLDDCEGSAPAVADVCARLLGAARDARFLITSRERLRIAEEHVIELDPLPVEAGAELFVARAKATRKTTLDPTHVEQIVRAVEGIPLAIELAAARLSVVGTAELLRRLPKPLDALATGARDARTRQRTLRATIDASWNLLTPHEQRALAQCAVFRGGFDADAAEAILDADESALDLLQSLREKSLVRAEEQDDGTLRLSLFESIRAYAEERLGEGAASAVERHARHYLSLGERLAERVDEHDGVAAMRTLRRELANLLSVHRRALERSSREEALRAVIAVAPVFQTRGPIAFLLQLLDEALAVDGEARPEIEARALEIRARERRSVGRLQEAYADVARARVVAAGDVRIEARLSAVEGNLAWTEASFARALACFERAIEQARAAGDAKTEARALGNLGAVANEEGRLLDASELLQQALRLVRRIGDLRTEAIFLVNLGETCFKRRRFDEAQREFERALALCDRIGDVRRAVAAHGTMGVLLAEQGDFAAGRDHLVRAVESARAVGDLRFEGIFVGALGTLEHEQGDDAAEETLQRSCELLERAGDRRWRALFSAELAALRAAKGRTDAAPFDEAEERLKNDASLLAAVRIHRGHLDLALARASSGADADAHRSRARARLDEAEGNEDSDDVRSALRILTRALETAPPPRASLPPAAEDAGALIVDAAGWFRPPGGARVDVSRRKALKLIVSALARERLEAPGRPLDADAVFRAGWPGERALRQASANRVYVALTTLRSMGLRDVLKSGDDGWFLDPNVKVELR